MVKITTKPEANGIERGSKKQYLADVQTNSDDASVVWSVASFDQHGNINSSSLLNGIVSSIITFLSFPIKYNFIIYNFF